MHFAAVLALLPVFLAANAAPASDSELAVQGFWPITKSTEGAKTRFTPHDGAPNGLYMSHNDTHLAYYGVPDSVNAEKRSPLIARQMTCDVSCNGETGNVGDMQTAENGLAGYCGDGRAFSGHVSYSWNSAWAFGCDYGNGQTCTSSLINFDVGCINAQCGNNRGGWNSHHSWRSTYGIEIGSFGC